MMMAGSLFRALKAQDPALQLDVLAPAWSKPLTSRMPEINKAITMPLQHGELNLKARYRLGKQLRTEQYDCAYVLPNSFKSALIPKWAKIKKRIGWRGEMRYPLLNNLRVLEKNKYPLMVQRYVALAHTKNYKLPSRLLVPRINIRFLYPSGSLTISILSLIISGISSS